MAEKYSVGAYYFPNYHIDPRNERVHGKGWTEWQLVKYATPRFPGHQQPKVPLWGYVDEADPKVMEKKINAAADHGIDYWIFDWYWYDDGPFLQRCLEDGYLHTSNHGRVKFCCMWANHTWLNIHPKKLREPIQELYPGCISRSTFETMTDHIIEVYFKHPSHYMVDGCPYFSIYELSMLLNSFGGVAETREALEDFRLKTKAAGFKDLHLNAVFWGRPILPGEQAPPEPAKRIEELGFDSITSYVWIHHVHLKDTPTTDYEYVLEEYLRHWDKVEKEFGLPYFPNVTMGWDSSPRTVQSEIWEPVGYPFTNVMGNNSPAVFEKALRVVKARLDQSDCSKILNINCWNEWTEGSYLEPDTIHKMAYLEAIRDVFAETPETLTPKEG